MSFINPLCLPEENCCEITFTGFCLEDGTPIGITVQEDIQVGWFNFLTAVFTLGPPPVGTTSCPFTASNLDVSGSVVALDAPTLAALDSIIAVSVKSTTPIQTSVAGSDSNVSLLVSNPVRLGATIFNDNTSASANNLYLKLGSIASLTSFSCKIDPGGYYETPFNFIGDIDGIWDFNVGNARITELT